jgi:hypothetical protein
MRKYFIVIIIVACFIAISGCAGAPEPTPAPAPAPAPVATPAPTPAATPAPVATAEPVREGIILEGAVNHTVAQGDTLSLIAARRYGQANMYYFPLIRLANSNVVSNPDVIEARTVLVIPDLQRNLNSAGSRAMMRADMLSAAQHYDRQGRPVAAAELRRLAGNL